MRRPGVAAPLNRSLTRQCAAKVDVPLGGDAQAQSRACQAMKADPPPRRL